MKKVVAMAIIFGFLFAFTVPEAKSAEMVLKAVTMFPKPHLNNDPVPIFVDKVNKRAQGRLRIDWVGGPEVIKGFDQPHAMKAGTIDMRKTGAFELWSEIFEKRLNAKYIGRLHSLIPFQLYTNKEVKTVDDFKGLKIRVMPLYIPFMKALGAAPVMIPPPDIYTSMERGVVDGFMWPNVGVISWGLQEVTKYVIRPGVFQMEPATLIHMAKWNQIPKDLQEMIMDVVQDVEYIGSMRNEMITEKEDMVRKEAGMKDIVLPPGEAEKFRNLAYDKTWEVVIKNAPENGPKLRELSSKKAIPKGTFPWQ